MSQRLLAMCLCALAAATGCASEQPPARDARAWRRALIAQPCAGMPATVEPVGSSYARVFIQAAQVRAAALPSPLGSSLTGRAIETPGVISFVGENGTPTSVSFERCLDEACAATEPWSMTVTPALPSSAREPVRLAIELQRQQAAAQPHGDSLETGDQTPVVMDLGGTMQASAWSLVVTPYLIGGDEDLRRLAECKARAAQRHGS